MPITNPPDPSALMDYGLYLFQFSAGESTPFGYPDIDSDKSRFLQVTAPDGATFVSDDLTTAVYAVTYTLPSDRRATISF
jgi:hypothetical protein